MAGTKMVAVAKRVLWTVGLLLAAGQVIRAEQLPIKVYTTTDGLMSVLSVNQLLKLLSSFEACLDYDLEPDYYSASAISDRSAPFINSRRTHLTYTSERKVTLLLAACASRESQQRCGATFGLT